MQLLLVHFQLRNYDQTWKVFYQYSSHATRKKHRDFVDRNPPDNGHRDLRSKKRVIKKKKNARKPRAQGLEEDFRLDPVSGVSWSVNGARLLYSTNTICFVFPCPELWL